MPQNAVNNTVTNTGSYEASQVQTVTVLLEPDGKELEIPRVKTVRQLFAALKIEEETALVIRDNCLLTPDRKLAFGDRIRVRRVSSRG